jgi:t-SNARE complex subunit (syntaxin)
MEGDKLENIQHKLESVTTVMNDNIQFALQNTDKIDNIQQKSDFLVESSQKFNGKASMIKRQMCAKYWKHNVIITLVILVIVIIIILIFTK